ASSSARNRSTMPLCRASSSRDSPTIRPARSVESRPTSLRSETIACWRSASICLLADSVMRLASAWACWRISAMIEAPCSLASSRMAAASSRASASWALYSRRAASASSCAFSACCIPPSIAAVRSAYAFSRLGTTYLATTQYRIPNAIRPKMNSGRYGMIGRAVASGSAASTAGRAVRVLAVSCTMVSSGTVPPQRGTRVGQVWGGPASEPDEEQHQGEDRERLGEREAQDGDRLEDLLGLRLTGHAVDVGGEDQTHADGRADRSEAVAEQSDVTSHVILFLCVVPGGSGRPGAKGLFSCRSVLVHQGATDVGGSQEDEDVGLQE